MTLDLSKLSPAPWEADIDVDEDGSDWTGKFWCGVKPADTWRTYIHSESTITNALFCALARNAFDVMQRRQFWVVPHRDGKQWIARAPGDELDRMPVERVVQADPFTALVEADKWMKEKEKVAQLMTPHQ